MHWSTAARALPDAQTEDGTGALVTTTGVAVAGEATGEAVATGDATGAFVVGEGAGASVVGEATGALVEGAGPASLSQSTTLSGQSQFWRVLLKRSPGAHGTRLLGSGAPLTQ